MGWNGGFFGAMVIALLAAGVSAADTVGPDKVIGGAAYGSEAAFSPDGTKVFVPVYGFAAATWDLATGARVVEFAGNGSPINAVDYSSDGTMTLTGMENAKASLWNAATGEFIREFAGHTGAIIEVAFSPDGTRVLTASYDKTAILWDTQTGAPLRTLVGHDLPLNAVDYSPDGTLVLTASDDGTIRVWNAESGTEVRILAALDRKPAFDAVFSPDGASVLGTTGGVVRLWSIATGLEFLAFPTSRSWFNNVAFAPDGNEVFASASSGLVVEWDIQSGEAVPTEFVGHAEWFIGATSYSPDGTMLLTTHASGGGTRLWDAKTGAPIPAPFDHYGAIYSLDYSPFGGKIITGHDFGMAVLWDAASGRALRDFTGPRYTGTVAEFSPNGTMLLTGAYNGIATLWQASTATVLQLFGTGEAKANAPVFSPDGGKVLYFTDSDEVHIRDAGTGQVLSIVEPGLGRLLSVAMTPDQSRLLLLVGGWPGDAVIWDLESAAAVHAWTKTRRAELSPNGTQVLINDVDGALRLYSTQTGAELRDFAYSGDRIWDMEFSPDGTQAATVAWEEILLWDVTTGLSTRSFERSRDYNSTITFTPDAKHLVTGGYDGAILLWDAAAPRITLEGDAEITIVCGDALEIPGATAYDPQDGDLSANVVASLEADDIVSSGTYTVDYSVTDSDGNAAPIVSRTIVVQDTTPPVVTLNGPAVVEMICNDLYVELGATAVDSCDGVLEVQISEVDVEKFWYENVVEIIYTATDAAGNQSEPVVRTLIVYSDDCNCKIGSSKCPPPEGEGDSQTEGEGEGSQEGAEEGEGATEGSAEGEGEGEIEGSVDGEGSADGEGELEGSVDGEGELEGSTEGDEEGEPTPPVSGPPGCFAEDGTMRPFSEVLGDWLAYFFSFALLLGAATRFRAGG
jgi:WD40 repeat protein